jgi:hypothetical protein
MSAEIEPWGLHPVILFVSNTGGIGNAQRAKEIQCAEARCPDLVILTEALSLAVRSYCRLISNILSDK